MFKIGERKAPGLLSIASVFRILIGLNVDPYTDTDPDPAFQVNADPDPDQGF